MAKRFQPKEVSLESVRATILWQSPPPEARVRARFRYYTAVRQFVALLEERPGIWARYPERLKNAHQYATVYRGTEWAYGPAETDGKRPAWARWVGLGPTIPAPSSQADLWARLEAEATGAEPVPSGPRRGGPQRRLDPDRPQTRRRPWLGRQEPPEGQP